MISDPITVLGIETSCDETAAAVVRLSGGKAEILSNIVHSQTDHANYGGVVPEIAARAHVSYADAIVLKALSQARIKNADDMKQLDAVAVTAGPGLIGGVIVGMMTAKAICIAHSLPLVPLNHLSGHALSARLSGDVAFPFLLLLVSGGHTQLLQVNSPTSFTRLGTTIDDAAGEAFDKTAKLLDLGQPGGPKVEAAARHGMAGRFKFPRPLLNRDSCDFSFSGLKTAVRTAAKKIAPLERQDRYDLAAAFQQAATAHLIAKTSSAQNLYTERLGHTDKRLVIAGGVAANQYLRNAFEVLCDQTGWSLSIPPLEYCTDNGAMIALAGAEMIAHHGIPDQEIAMQSAPRARWPLDDDPSGARHGGGKKGPKA